MPFITEELYHLLADGMKDCIMLAPCGDRAQTMRSFPFDADGFH
jgi:hypothetical protein